MDSTTAWPLSSLSQLFVAGLTAHGPLHEIRHISLLHRGAGDRGAAQIGIGFGPEFFGNLREFIVCGFRKSAKDGQRAHGHNCDDDEILNNALTFLIEPRLTGLNCEKLVHSKPPFGKDPVALYCDGVGLH